MWDERIHDTHISARGAEFGRKGVCAHKHTYTRAHTKTSLARMADTDFWLKYLFSHERWVKRLKGLHDGRRKQNLKVG